MQAWARKAGKSTGAEGGEGMRLGSRIADGAPDAGSVVGECRRVPRGIEGGDRYANKTAVATEPPPSTSELTGRDRPVHRQGGAAEAARAAGQGSEFLAAVAAAAQAAAVRATVTARLRVGAQARRHRGPGPGNGR